MLGTLYDYRIHEAARLVVPGSQELMRNIVHLITAAMSCNTINMDLYVVIWVNEHGDVCHIVTTIRVPWTERKRQSISVCVTVR